MPTGTIPESGKLARTKIVATLGPASSAPDQLAALVDAGVDVFRLNMAHAEPEEQQEHVDNIRALSQQLGRPIGILADLAGPKIRLGELPGDSVECERDAELSFITGDGPKSRHPHPSPLPEGEGIELTSNYAPLVNELEVGDRVMLADGTVALEVTAKEPGRARARVVQGGVIRSRQGINLPGVKLSIPAISDRDHRHAVWAAQAGVDFVGLSFVRTPDEVHQLKDILQANGSAASVVAKIEKLEALARLDAIVEAADLPMASP